MPISIATHGIEEYARQGREAPLPAFPEKCPHCLQAAHWRLHGWYKRKVSVIAFYLSGIRDGRFKLSVRRIRCVLKGCGHTIGLLPSFRPAL